MSLRVLGVMPLVLNVIWEKRENQCRPFSKGVMRSNVFKPLMRYAAVCWITFRGAGKI